MMRVTKVVIAALLVALLVAVPSASAYQAATFQSDEFNPCGPLGVWTPTTSVTGQTITSTRTHMVIAAPPGPTQTISQDAVTKQLIYNVPRMVQPFGGTGTEDFGIEVKFDSNMSKRWQQQGIVLEATPTNLLRFEFHSRDASTIVVFAQHIYNQTFDTGVRAVRQDYISINTTMTGASSLYMRVSRTGGAWKMEYKADSDSWTEAALIDPAKVIPANFRVTGVGFYAGTTKPSDGVDAPGHTANVDYFFNTASPIVDGDNASNKLTVDVVGQGSVVLTPEQPTDGYACGTEVLLRASATDPWNFARWEGAVSGTVNPTTIVMNGGNQTVTAVFRDTPGPQLNFHVRLPLLAR